MAKNPPQGVLEHLLRLAYCVELGMSGFSLLGQMSHLGLQGTDLVLNCKERVFKRSVATSKGSKVLFRHGGLVHQSKLLRWRAISVLRKTCQGVLQQGDLPVKGSELGSPNVQTVAQVCQSFNELQVRHDNLQSAL